MGSGTQVFRPQSPGSPLGRSQVTWNREGPPPRAQLLTQRVHECSILVVAVSHHCVFGNCGKNNRASLVAQLVKDSCIGKIRWRRDRLPTPVFLGFPCGSAGKESTCNVGDLGSIPGLGRSPGEGKGYPLQYSALENMRDCIVHRVAKSLTRLSDFMNTTEFQVFCYITAKTGTMLVVQSCLTLQRHGLQHARLPCPSVSFFFDTRKHS